jgi:hypothetical protein
VRSGTFLYRLISLFLAAGFAAFAVLFFLFPDHVLAFPARATERMDNRFFVALSAAYLVLVAAIAWSMYRKPWEPAYPLLLCQAKGASSLLLLALFFLQEPLPIYLAKGIVDACLSFLGLAMFLRLREGSLPSGLTPPRGGSYTPTSR